MKKMNMLYSVLLSGVMFVGFGANAFAADAVKVHHKAHHSKKVVKAHNFHGRNHLPVDVVVTVVKNDTSAYSVNAETVIGSSVKYVTESEVKNPDAALGGVINDKISVKVTPVYAADGKIYMRVVSYRTALALDSAKRDTFQAAEFVRDIVVVNGGDEKEMNLDQFSNETESYKLRVWAKTESLKK